MLKETIIRYKIILSLLLGFILVLIWPIPFDIFHLETDKEVQEYFDSWTNIIIGSLASLSGIIITILIISYEIKKEKLGRNAKKYFLEEINIKVLLQIFVGTLLVASISKMIIAVGFEKYANTILVLNILYFFTCVILIIPLSVRAVLSFDIYSIIKVEVNNITIENLLTHSRLHPFVSGVEVEKEREKYPLYLLLELATNRKEGEIFISRTISREVTFQLISLLKKSYNERKTLDFEYCLGKRGGYLVTETVSPFKPYIYFFDNLFLHAVSNKSEYLVESYLNDLYLLFLELIQLKVSPFETNDLFECFKESIIVLSKNDMNKSFVSALTLLETVLIRYLTYNCPKGYHIRSFQRIYGEDLYYIENREEDFKWGILRDNYIFSLKEILKNNNHELKVDFYSSVFFTYKTFMAKVERINHLDIYQKGSLLFLLHANMKYELERSYSQWENKSLLEFINCNPFDSSYLTYAIEKDAFYLKDYFVISGNYFYELSQNINLTSVEVSLYSNLLNQTLSRSHQSVNCDKGFVFLFNILLEVKKYIEKELGPNNIEGYLEIGKTLKYLQKQINLNVNFSKYNKIVEDAVISLMQVPQEKMKGSRFKWVE